MEILWKEKFVKNKVYLISGQETNSVFLNYGGKYILEDSTQCIKGTFN